MLSIAFCIVILIVVLLSVILLSVILLSVVIPMRLCHPPDGSTSPKYKLLCFITTNFFCKEKNALAFNGVGAAT